MLYVSLKMFLLRKVSVSLHRMNFLKKKIFVQRSICLNSEKIHHAHDATRMCKEAIYKTAYSVILEIWFLSQMRRNPSKQKGSRRWMDSINLLTQTPSSLFLLSSKCNSMDVCMYTGGNYKSTPSQGWIRVCSSASFVCSLRLRGSTQGNKAFAHFIWPAGVP